MMGAARTTVVLGVATELQTRAYRSTVTGEQVALLDIGDGADVAIFGPPAALRRPALEAVRVAEDAEQLDTCEPVRAAA